MTRNRPNLIVLELAGFVSPQTAGRIRRLRAPELDSARLLASAKFVAEEDESGPATVRPGAR